MKLFSNKKLLWLTAGISLFGVFVASIATAAWFQVDSQPLQASMTPHTPNLTIDNANVTGYKIQPSLGIDGFPYYDSSTVSSKKGGSYDTTNHNQDEADINFDVPEGGLGYYLIKKNPSDTYKYKYNGISYSWKFAELDNNNVKYCKVDASTIGTINSTDTFIVREYSYNVGTYSTVNVKVPVVADVGGMTIDATTYEITPPATGNYSVWFNKDTKKVSFETTVSVSTKNLAGRAKIKDSLPKRNVSVNSSKAYILISKSGTVGDWGNISELKIDTYTTYNNTDSSRRKTCSNNFSEDADFYYYEIATSVKDIWLSFKQIDNGNNYYYTAHHTSSSYSTYQAGKVYEITNFVWISDGSETAYYNFSGWNNGDISWNSTNSGDRGLVGMTMTNSSYTLASTTTRTIYLYDRNGNSSYYGATPYAHVWQNAENVWPKKSEGLAFPGKTMTKVRDYFYSVTISTSYDRIIFSNGSSGNSNQSEDITISTTTSNAWKATGVRSGSWYNPNTSDSTRTYYLYDPYSIIVSFNSSVPYAYLWDSTSQYSSSPNASYPGLAMTAAASTYSGTTISSRLWKITTSSTFDRIIFNDGRSTSTYKTVDIEGLSANHNNAIYVLTGGSGTSITGEWYLDLPSENVYTFYYFDNGSRGNTWSTPAVYAWDSSNIINGTYQTTNGIKNLFKSENNTWSGGGISMSHITSGEATSLNVNASYVWKAVVSQSYDSIIFTNGSTTGGTNQTIDLTSISSHNNHFFVITGTEGGKVTGSWHEHIYSVEYYATFWLDGTTQLSFDSSTAHLFNGTILAPNLTDYTFGVENFSVATSVSSSVPSTITKSDSTNGIVYGFDRVGTSFYTDESCSSTFINGNTLSLTDGVGKLYVKYNVNSADFVSIYVDDAAWSNENLAVKTSGNDLTYFTSSGSENWKVATGLYRVTLRNDWVIQLSSGSHTSYNLTTNDGGLPNMGSGTAGYYRVNTSTSTTYNYLRIGSSGAGSSWAWVNYKSTSATGVWVQKYSGGSWSNVANGQLLHGDGVGNDFILESGLPLTNNDVIRVCNTKNTVSTSDDVIYGYAQYVSSNTSKHTYVKTYNSGNAIQITRLGSDSQTARFNFYITHTGNISIAMVPDYGNGFYIMEYNSTDKTENFIGAIKMDSSDYTASYDGYYCSDTSKKIFIRSYMNAVDNICTSLTPTSLTYATMNTSSGDDLYCITFKATGHYNIKVTNQIVDISPYNVDDFFSLNRLDSSLVLGKGSDLAKQQEIWRQKTAVVMEIPFVANNPYDATVQLKTVCSASYIGVRFAVYSSKQNDPYTLLHGGTNALYTTTYLTAANTPSPISDSNSLTLDAGTASTYYAYVLIDYRYTVTAANLIEATPEVGLYLQIVQS